MKKRLLSLIIVFAMFAGMFATIPMNAYAEESMRILVMRLNSTKSLLDGNKIQVDPSNDTVAPFTLFGKTMVPVRFIEQLGAKVKYTSTTEPVTVTYGNTLLSLEFDKPVMRKEVSGGVPVSVTLPTAPTMVEGKTCVPIREIAEALGFGVNYNSKSFVIVVSNGKISPAEITNHEKLGESDLPTFVQGVMSISVKSPSRTVKANDSIQIDKSDITFTPSKVGCDKLIYSSSDTSIATVTSNGKIIANSKSGNVTITIKSHNGKTAEVSLFVDGPPIDI